MRQIVVEIACAGLIALYVGAFLFIFAWFTVFPTVGVLWSIGWLK
jgi:hypothetical protein